MWHAAIDETSVHGRRKRRRKEREKKNVIFTGRNLMAHNFSSLRLSLAWTVERSAWGTVLDEISYSTIYPTDPLRSDMSLRLCKLGHRMVLYAQRTLLLLLLFTRVLNCLFVLIGRNQRSKPLPFTLDYAVVLLLLLLLLPTRPLLCVFKLWYFFFFRSFILVRIECGIRSRADRCVCIKIEFIKIDLAAGGACISRTQTILFSFVLFASCTKAGQQNIHIKF